MMNRIKQCCYSITTVLNYIFSTKLRYDEGHWTLTPETDHCIHFRSDVKNGPTFEYTIFLKSTPQIHGIFLSDSFSFFVPMLPSYGIKLTQMKLYL
jgi:hypothetical protein